MVGLNRGWLGMFSVSIYLATNQTGRYRNVDKNVKDAYSWLVRNYRGEDQIYLFGASRLQFTLVTDGLDTVVAGFSRGAYQVRALAAVIHEVGPVPICRIADD